MFRPKNMFTQKGSDDKQTIVIQKEYVRNEFRVQFSPLQFFAVHLLSLLMVAYNFIPNKSAFERKYLQRIFLHCTGL